MTKRVPAGLGAPPRRDALFAVLVALVIQQDHWLSPDLGHRVGPSWVVACCYGVTSLALAWRRSAPLAVLAAVWTVNVAQDLAYGAPESLGAFLPALIALYSLGRHAPARTGWWALPMTLVGMGVHEWRDPRFSWTAGATFFFWAVLAAAWPLGQAFRRRASAISALAEQTAELERDRELLAQQATAAERARIARELHDVVGHGLTVIVLQLEASLGLLDNGDVSRLRDRLLGVQRSARLALDEMRRLVGLLDADEPAALAPQPGLAELDRLIADSRAAGVHLDAVTDGAPVELPPGLDLAAFRVAQEAVTNVLRHARPPVASLTVRYEPRRVVVEVRDCGTADSSPRAAGGRGIAGMRERVALYGGELEVGRHDGGGFRVCASFPLDGAKV